MPPRETPTRMESYVLAEDAFDESNLPTVLLLKISGWTPGPINCLRSKIQTDFACEIIEPRLIMPVRVVYLNFAYDAIYLET